MRQKQLLLSLLILLLSAFRVEATTYTVKAGGGGDYTTIQSCARAAEAGDTCIVYAGAYEETPSLKNSGAPGRPITFSVHSGDCVKVTGFNLNSISYVTLGTPNAPRCTNGSFSYSGFEVTGGQITWRKINNVILQNN